MNRGATPARSLLLTGKRSSHQGARAERQNSGTTGPGQAVARNRPKKRAPLRKREPGGHGQFRRQKTISCNYSSSRGDPELRRLPRARQAGEELLDCLPVFFGTNGVSVSS